MQLSVANGIVLIFRLLSGLPNMKRVGLVLEHLEHLANVGLDKNILRLSKNIVEQAFGMRQLRV